MVSDRELIEQSANQMAAFRLPRWREFPDLDIYMDQLISLISRYFKEYPGYEEKSLTPSMVNNYVKQGIMPAPIRKKYSRIHLASLIVINVLKASIPIARVGEIIAESLDDEEGIESLYDFFCDCFEKTCESVAESSKTVSSTPERISRIITKSAIRSSVEQSLALELIKNKEKNS